MNERLRRQQIKEALEREREHVAVRHGLTISYLTTVLNGGNYVMISITLAALRVTRVTLPRASYSRIQILFSIRKFLRYMTADTSVVCSFPPSV